MKIRPFSFQRNWTPVLPHFIFPFLIYKLLAHSEVQCSPKSLLSVKTHFLLPEIPGPGGLSPPPGPTHEPPADTPCVGEFPLAAPLSSFPEGQGHLAAEAAQSSSRPAHCDALPPDDTHVYSLRPLFSVTYEGRDAGNCGYFHETASHCFPRLVQHAMTQGVPTTGVACRAAFSPFIPKISPVLHEAILSSTAPHCPYNPGILPSLPVPEYLTLSQTSPPGGDGCSSGRHGATGMGEGIRGFSEEGREDKGGCAGHQWLPRCACSETNMQRKGKVGKKLKQKPQRS